MNTFQPRNFSNQNHNTTTRMVSECARRGLPIDTIKYTIKPQVVKIERNSLQSYVAYDTFRMYAAYNVDQTVYCTALDVYILHVQAL